MCVMTSGIVREIPNKKALPTGNASRTSPIPSPISMLHLLGTTFLRRAIHLGDPRSKSRVPEQFSHNLSLGYSIKNGRYNFSLECRNFTNEKLYDNFSLQKAGRAFYGKFRVYFGK